MHGESPSCTKWFNVHHHHGIPEPGYFDVAMVDPRIQDVREDRKRAEQMRPQALSKGDNIVLPDCTWVWKVRTTFAGGACLAPVDDDDVYACEEDDMCPICEFQAKGNKTCNVRMPE